MNPIVFARLGKFLATWGNRGLAALGLVQIGQNTTSEDDDSGVGFGWIVTVLALLGFGYFKFRKKRKR